MIVGIEVDLSPGNFMLDGDQPPVQNGGVAQLPNYRLISIAVKGLGASRWHLVWKYTS